MPPAGPTTHALGKLSGESVAQYARNAGFPEEQIPMATAVAWLESRFDPNIEGKADPRDKGLMQINSHYHPEVLQINWRDPQANMNLAHKIWAADGWSQWHTAGSATVLSKSPTFQAYAKSSASSQSTANAIGGVIGDAIDAAKAPLGILQLMTKGATFFSDPRNWERIIFVALGGALVLAGLYSATRPVTQPLVDTGKKMAAVAATVAK